ncbi:MAG TPA: hypothetical protein PLW70_08390 [Bacteroidales bacterium]|nr:hypothetical protein [Bacteroidales bacterium]
MKNIVGLFFLIAFLNGFSQTLSEKLMKEIQKFSSDKDVAAATIGV